MIESPAVRREFTLKWRFGLRTAMLVHRVAAHYESSVELTSGRDRASAKDLASLACFTPDQGQRLSLSAAGPDAAAALAVFSDLFTAGDAVARCAHDGCRSTPILTGFNDRSLEYSCAKLHLWSVERATGTVQLS